MSIEIDNPKTVVGKIDAAANYVQQMHMSYKVGDSENFNYSFKQASDLLYKAILQIEKKNES